MNIYIEDAIVLNAIILLSFTFIISNIFGFKLCILKSVLGSLVSAFFTIIFAGLKFGLVLQAISILFLLSISYKNLNVKKLVQCFVLFFIISSIFSSVMSINFIAYNNIFVSSTTPVFLLLITMFLFIFILKKCLKFLVLKTKSASNLCKIEARFNNKTVKTFGYLDTGNNLTYNNQPVSIINFKLFESLTGISLGNYLLKNFDQNKFNYIDVFTVTGEQSMLSFKINELKIYHNKTVQSIKNAKLAISLKLGSFKDYDIILNNNYIN